jgi:16S rRNA (adenine1518-N6/adenine1519-N6)-dimethyltransferase
VTGRDAFASYRARLDALGFRPSSSLGQNFLLDPSLHKVIAAAAAPRPGDLVLEIGVGLGFLTRELAATGATVIGVEIDARLLEVATDELRACPNVHLVHADAIDGETLHPTVLAAVQSRLVAGRFIVCANLPYAVAGPLLAKLACLERLPDGIVVLVQKELAVRLAAAPGHREFGNLAVLLQSMFAVTRLREVPPQVFRPRPKVDSSVLLLRRRDDVDAALQPAAARWRWQAFLRAIFQQRRKTLRTTLPAAAAQVSAVPPARPATLLARRAEDLTVAELLSLWRDLAAAPST